MTYPPDIVAGTLNVLIGPRAEREAMIELSAMLALRGPVRVLDGGNCFDAYRVARRVRRQTPHLDEVLGRIQVARAFTCYQVVTLFRQTPAGPAPQLIFDLLAAAADQVLVRDTPTVPAQAKLL